MLTRHLRAGARHVLFSALVLVALTGVQSGATGLEKNYTQLGAGPILVDWNAVNYQWNGVSANAWQDTSASLLSGGTTYSPGIGQVSQTWGGGPGIADWWLDGRYTTINVTARMDDRTSSPYAKAQVWADGTLLAESGYLGSGGSWTPAALNVTGAQRVQLRVLPDTWGGRPYQYLFWSQATVTPDPALTIRGYYADGLVNGASNSHAAWGNSTNYLDKSGYSGTTPSFDTWADNSQPLRVGGNAVSGFGLRGAPWNGASTDSIRWTIAQSADPLLDYKMLKFALAPDSTRLGSPNSNNCFLQIWNGGTQIFSTDMNAVTAYRVFTTDITGATSLDFRLVNPGGGWGGAPAPYFVVTDIQLIAAVPEPAALTCLAIGALALICRRRA